MSRDGDPMWAVVDDLMVKVQALEAKVTELTMEVTSVHGRTEWLMADKFGGRTGRPFDG